MILTRPLVSKKAILACYRLGMEGDGEATFRTLHRKGVLSEGLSVCLRSDETGKLAGRFQVFSELNLDAVRLARHGCWDEAKAIAQRARDLEGDPATRQLVSSLDQKIAAADETDDFLDDLFRHSQTLGKLLTRLAGQVEEARKMTKALQSLVTVVAGAVQSADGEVAEIVADHGPRIAVPREQLAEQELDYQGAAVTVRREKLGRGSAFSQVEPAMVVDLDEDAPGQRHRYPFAPGEIRPGERGIATVKALRESAKRIPPSDRVIVIRRA